MGKVEAERLINRGKLNLDLSLINGSRNLFLLHISSVGNEEHEGACQGEVMREKGRAKGEK
jgi:hypothetical protein